MSTQACPEQSFVATVDRKLPYASVSKRVFVQNLCYENFDLHENGACRRNHFHMNGFARGLVLTQRQKETREYPIIFTREFE